MRDADKTKEQLINELAEMRQRVAEFDKEEVERKQAEERIKEKSERLKIIMNSLQHGIFVVDAETHKIVDVNPTCCEMVGIPREQIVGHVCHKFVCPADVDKCPVTDIGQTVDKSERVLLTAKGERIPILKTVTWSMLSGRRHLIESFMDITEHKRMEDKLKALSLTDELTALYNRRGFFTLTENLLKRAKRQKQRIFMLYADLDGLKCINDTLGHKEGDNALIDIANILKKTFRESDIVARMGGDEFAVIPAGTTGDNVEIVTARLQKQLDIHNTKSNHSCKLSMSVGIACYDPERPCSIDELLTQGDKLMYEQKRRKNKS